MSISLNLIDTVAHIEKKILRAIVDEANKGFLKSVVKSNEPLKVIVRSALEASPELSSLNGATLRADFGIPIGKDVTTPIVSAIAESITFMTQKFSVKGKNISGGVTIGIQPSSFVNLLGLGITETENNVTGITTTNETGSNTAHNTMHPFLVLNYIILAKHPSF